MPRSRALGKVVPASGKYLKEALVGLALAAILPTRYRLGGAVGVGELSLLAVGLGIISLALLRGQVVFHGALGRISFVLAVYVFLVSLPLTAIGLYFGVPGVAFRDWLAYAFSAIVLLACSVGRLHLRVAALFMIGFVCVLIVFQYFLGGEAGWYYARFTAGASNPNQLALYVACGASLALVCVAGVWRRGVILTFFFATGALTGSDALLASGVAAICAYGACAVLPKRVLLLVSPLLAGGLALLWMTVGDGLVEHFLSTWAVADEGGGRAALYMNGMRAWLDTPFTALIGNGAGSFSGLSVPFEGAEAHNTPIDLLSMGGIPALIVCYWGFFYLILLAYRRGENVRVALMVGLVVFSLFHFVARQPVWWFCLAVLAYLSHRRFDRVESV